MKKGLPVIAQIMLISYLIAAVLTILPGKAGVISPVLKTCKKQILAQEQSIEFTNNNNEEGEPIQLYYCSPSLAYLIPPTLEKLSVNQLPKAVSAIHKPSHYSFLYQQKDPDPPKYIFC